MGSYFFRCIENGKPFSKFFTMTEKSFLRILVTNSWSHNQRDFVNTLKLS